MTEEKPQKADLREQIMALPCYRNPSDPEYRVTDIEEILALIDADSKAREERDKRLADIADEYIEQLVGHLFSTHKCDHSAVSLVKERFHAALSASKQDSEGTG